MASEVFFESSELQHEVHFNAVIASILHPDHNVLPIYRLLVQLNLFELFFIPSPIALVSVALCIRLVG